MTWKNTLIFFLFLCGVLSVYFARSIEDPRLPDAITLPLGPINQQQTRGEYESINSVGNMSLRQLPKEAWCEQVNLIIENISFDCYWPSASKSVGQYARVVIELPRTGDVIYWRFDRDTLRAVPQSHSWLVLNIGKIMGALVFGLIALYGTFTLFRFRRNSSFT